MKRAIDDGWIRALPTENLRPLKWTPKKRSLITSEQIDQLCSAALKASKNAQQFCDYIRLMQRCGARRDETLRLRWPDVDWERKQLTVGSNGLSKNGQGRVVNFNAELEAH